MVKQGNRSSRKHPKTWISAAVCMYDQYSPTMPCYATPWHIMQRRTTCAMHSGAIPFNIMPTMPCNTILHYSMQCNATPCHTTPFNAVQRLAIQYHTMQRRPLCHVMQWNFVPFKAMQRHAKPCHAMPCHLRPCNTMASHAIQCHVLQCRKTPFNAMPRHTMQCNGMLWHSMQCNAMQCNAM